MNLAATKLELVKRLLETDDKDIIRYIKTIFDTHEGSWFDSLPEKVQASVSRGLEQSRKGEGVSHSEMKKRHKKWLKK